MPHATKPTIAVQVFLQDIRGNGSFLKKAFANVRKLDPLEVVGKNLQAPHSTISSWTERLNCRTKTQLRKVPREYT
jgi:hypothetical protein